MKTSKKLFYVACMALLLVSCEKTYNDKLFWPGEISQEYGSYIKPYTLDLTYSGEKLAGKTVNFKTEDSETGTLTLNDIIPGENTTPIKKMHIHLMGRALRKQGLKLNIAVKSHRKLCNCRLR